MGAEAWAGRPTGYGGVACNPDGIDVCYQPTGIDDQMRCAGVRIDDDEAATGVVMYAIYDSTWNSPTLNICDGEEYCAWGYRTVGASVTKFFCAWSDDGLAEDWLIGTTDADVLSFHDEQGNYMYTLADTGCSAGLLGKQFGDEGDDVLHGSWYEASTQYADDLHGDDNADTIYTHDGNGEATGVHDAAWGGNHADTIWGGPGIELVQAEGGNDSVVTTGGDDVVSLGAAGDVATLGFEPDEGGDTHADDF